MTASGMSYGVLMVLGDGSYTAVPTLTAGDTGDPSSGFGNPATATSMAQAVFEQWFPLILDPTTFPLAQQAAVVDTTTTPPTTAKGRTMKTLSLQVNAIVAGIVGYIQANAVANVTTQSLGQVPSSLMVGTETPIDAPASPVLVPIK